jgi:hypothetical protein
MWQIACLASRKSLVQTSVPSKENIISVKHCNDHNTRKLSPRLIREHSEIWVYKAFVLTQNSSLVFEDMELEI